MKSRLRRAAAAIAALLVCAAAGAFLLLESDAARRAIEGLVSAQAGAEVRYEELSVRLFPLPHAEMRGATIRIAGVAEGRLPAVRIRFELLPLLTGSFRPSDIRLSEPTLQLSVKAGTAGDPLSRYREAVGPVVALLARENSRLSLSVEGGRIEVFSAGRPIVSLSELAGSASVSAQGLELDAQGVSDLWQKAQLRGRIEAVSLDTSGSVQLTGLRLDEILNGAAPKDAVRLRPAPVDVAMQIETRGNQVRVVSSGAAPQLALQYGSRRRDLGATRATWELVLDGERLACTLKDLQVGAALSGGSGVLRAAPGDAALPFEFRAEMLDLAQVHAVAAALAGEGGAVPVPATLVPAGILRQLSLSGTWPNGAAVMDIGALRGESRIEAATVAAKAAGIEVREGKGRFVLAGGELRGSELAGKIGRSSFSDGALELELSTERLRSLNAAMQADLADALAIARRLLGPQAPAAVAGIEALEGRSSGNLAYDARRGAAPLTLAFAGIRAKGRHRSVPFPLELEGGALRYTHASLQLRGLAGSVGGSRVRDAGMEIALGPAAYIKSASGDMTLVLGEIHPWMRSLAALPASLGSVRTITGNARVRIAKLSGPLAGPAHEFQATVEPQDMTLKSRLLHAPWRFTAGTAEIDERTVKLNGIAIAAGNARATVSGTIGDYASDARHADLTFSKVLLGRKPLEWARARWQLPAGAMPRAPVAVATAHLQWPGAGSGPLAAQGKARIGNAVDADFDLAWKPSELQVKRLALKDADSDARVVLRLAPALEDLSVDGSLDTRTLVRMLAQQGAGAGALRVVFAGQSMDLTGRLEGRQNSGRQNSLVVDGRVTAKTLDAERLRADALPKTASGTAGRATFWDLPVTGRLGLSAGSISYGRHVLQKVVGTVELAPRRVFVDATEATLCGIAVPFSAAITPAEVDAKAKPQARGLVLGETLFCLLGQEEEFTGTLELDAELAAKGTVDAIEKVARGSFRAVIRDGLIREAGMIGRTLSAEEVAARLPSDARKLAEGFAFGEINLAGTIEGGKAHLDPGILDSPALGLTVRGDVGLADGALDLEGLVAPIRRDAKGEVVAGSSFGGGSLVAIPVRIRGNFHDPKVDVQAAQAVATTLLKVLGARFLLPIRLLDITTGAGAPPQPPAD